MTHLSSEVGNKQLGSKSRPRAVKLTVSRLQRSTPYTQRIEEHGVSDYSMVNRTILPKGFG